VSRHDWDQVRWCLLPVLAPHGHPVTDQARGRVIVRHWRLLCCPVSQELEEAGDMVAWLSRSQLEAVRSLTISGCSRCGRYP
jgi:hypothetical protein